MPAGGQTRAYLVLTVIAALWGSYPAFSKLALEDLPPYWLVSVRCTLASAFLVTLLLRRGGRAALGGLDRQALGQFALLGFAGIFVSTGGTYLGIALTTAGSAAILQAATPVMVALGARLYLGERLRGVQWAGVLCSAAGVLLVVTRGSWRVVAEAGFRAGDLILLGAMAGWSVYTVYGKRVLARHSPEVATTAAYVLGSAMLLPMAPLTAPWFPPPDIASPVAWAVVLYQAILGALAHVWWYEGVRVVGPSRTAIFMNLQPGVGVALAWLMLGERIGWPTVAGGALILTGVALTTRPDAAGGGAAPPAARR